MQQGLAKKARTESFKTVQFACLFICFLLSPSLFANTQILDANHSYSKPIGHFVTYYKEKGETLTASESLQKFNSGQFISSENAVLNFAISEHPIWVAIEVNNSSQSSITKQLLFKTPWLDYIELHFIENQQISKPVIMGDSYSFTTRKVNSRFFAFNHDYIQGKTLILARLTTPDPMVLPIYFFNSAQVDDDNVSEAYFYGFFYGAMLALFIYNLILFTSLNNAGYFTYSLHLLSFSLLNLSYTGHGFQWFWQNSQLWQQWGNPILIYFCVITGLMFATQYLNTKSVFPRIHKTILVVSILFFTSLILAFLLQNQSLAIILSFAYLVSYAIILTILSLLSLSKNDPMVRYFMLAVSSLAISISINSAAIWGFIPFTPFTFHSGEIGVVLEATFLALALAYMYRTTNKKKSEAELLARTDPMTSLNNRRAFNEEAELAWKKSEETSSTLSIIMLDIDKFKQVNDTYGHAIGDAVIVRISKVLRTQNRVQDTVSRWGGEEFIVLLPNTSEEDASVIAERLRQQIYSISFRDLTVSCSFGVATKSTDINSLEELIAKADERLYLAKERGRNCVFTGNDVLMT